MNGKFRSNFAFVIDLFHKTCMVLYAGKYHYMYLQKNTENAAINFNDKTYAYSRKEIILGIEIDSILALAILRNYTRAFSICPLSRIVPYLDS